MPQQFRIQQHGPAWGLPTPDPRSLFAQALLRHVGADFVVENVPNAPIDPSVPFPVISYGNNVVRDVTKLPDALCSQGYEDSFKKLREDEKAETRAFLSVLFDRGLSAVLFAWFLDETCYDELYKDFTAKASFPLSFLLPIRGKRGISARARTFGIETVEDAEVAFSDIMEIMDQRLTKRFSYSESEISALDIAIASFAIAVEKSPKSCVLHRSLSRCTRVCSLTNAIVSTGVFGAEVKEIPAGEPVNRDEIEGTSEVSLDAEETKRRERIRQFFFTAGAVFLGYILFGNAVSVDIAADDDED